MKKIFFAVLVAIATTCAHAQTADTTVNKPTKKDAPAINSSVYAVHQNWDSKDIILSWTTFTKGKFSLQNRVNFDAANTYALIPGYMIKFKKFTIVPEVGVLFGKYNALSTEFYGYTTFDSTRFEAYLFGQHSFDFTGRANFAYTYGQVLWSLDKQKHFKFGVGAQYWQGTSSENQTAKFNDIGPQLIVSFWDNMYVKLWPTYDPINKRSKSIAGLGITL